MSANGYNAAINVMSAFDPKRTLREIGNPLRHGRILLYESCHQCLHAVDPVGAGTNALACSDVHDGLDEVDEALP